MSDVVRINATVDRALLDLWAAHDLLQIEGVAIAQGTRGETAADLEHVLSSISRPSTG